MFINTNHKVAGLSTPAAVEGNGRRPLKSIQNLISGERQRLLEKELGVRRAAINALDAEGAEHFLTLIQHGPRTAGLAVRIANAVVRTSRGRVNEAMKKLADYRGSLTILEDFLNRIGTDDPFVATERAQVVVLPVSQIPGSAVAADDIEKAGRVKVPHESVRGASGHIITGMIYCAYDSNSPAGSIGFFSKRQAITRPFEAFNPDRFTEEKAKTVRKRRERSYLDILTGLSLEDLEREPGIVSDSRSPVLLRDFAVYRELQDAIQDYRRQHAAILYGDGIKIASPGGLGVRTDAGGSFLGWFERRLEAGKDLPEGILVAYQSIKDPDVHLDPETERDYIRGLIAYQRVNSFITKDAALAGAASDLEEFDKLPSDDPLKLDPGVSEARRELQELAANPQGEIRVTDLGAILSKAGLSEFRSNMNRRTLERFHEEYEHALAYFDFLFTEHGRMLEDTLQGSVPMGRLSKTIYGAKVGNSGLAAEKEVRRPVLGQQDFRYILDGIFHKIVSRGEDARLLQSMPVRDFREMVEGAICAFRKAIYLDNCLEESGIKADRMDASTLPEDFQPVVPTGRNLRPAETFLEAEKKSGKEVLPLNELIERTTCLGLGDYKAKAQLPQYKAYAHAGVYPAAAEEPLKKLHIPAARFVSAQEIAGEMETVRKMLESPLVRIADTTLMKKRYFTNPERLIIEAAASFKPRFDGLGLQPSPENERLGEEITKLQGARVFTGGIVPAAEGRRARLELRLQDVRMFLGEKQESGLIYFKPEVLERQLEDLQNRYKATESIHPAWFGKAKMACSRKGQEILESHDMGLVDYETFTTSRLLDSSPLRFVSRRFVNAVWDLFRR